MENKVLIRQILLNRGVHTIGATQDATNRKAKKINFMVKPEEVENFEMPGVASTFKTMTKLIEDLDVEVLSEPMQICVTTQVHDIITKGSYKAWLMNGKLKNGKRLSEEELKIYQDFFNALDSKSLYVCFRTYLSCRLVDAQLKESAFKKLSADKKDLHAITMALEKAMDAVCPREQDTYTAINIENL